MQQSRTRAVNALKGNRNFSTSTQRLAVSPFRRPAQAVSSKITQEDAKRPQSTAAAAATQTQSRSRPSPAFNREDYKDVQPLKQYRSPAMDHSFVGMTGGEIFHEMMLRQGVKHICMTHLTMLTSNLCTKLQVLTPPSRLPRWCDSSRLRCHLPVKTLRLHPSAT
jgi:hypothetical protein